MEAILQALDSCHVVPRFLRVPTGNQVQLGSHRRPIVRPLPVHQPLGLNYVARAGVVAGQGEGDPLLQRPRGLPDRPHPRVVVDPGLDVVLHQPGRCDPELGRDPLPGAGHDLHQALGPAVDARRGVQPAFGDGLGLPPAPIEVCPEVALAVLLEMGIEASGPTSRCGVRDGKQACQHWQPGQE